MPDAETGADDPEDQVRSHAHVRFQQGGGAVATSSVAEFEQTSLR